MSYADIYNDRFFARRHRLETAEQQVAQILIDHFNPSSVLDLGCAIGSYLEVFAEHGIDIAGCDVGYAYAKPYMSPEIRKATFGFDLGQPLEMPKKYDLVMSVEVAEHLPESAARQFCLNLVNNASGWIFLTAAKSKRGKGHINPRPKEYWIKIMNGLGAEYKKTATRKLRGDIGKLLGLRWRTMVFSVEGI